MASLNYPYSFTNNSTADANQVNSNFAAAKTFVEANVVQTDGSVQAGTSAIADGAVTTAKLATSARPGLIHVNTTTMNSEWQKTISNVFTSAYRSYRVVISGLIPQVGNIGGTIQFNLTSGGTPNTTSNYFRQGMYAIGGSVASIYETLGYVYCGDSNEGGVVFTQLEIDCPQVASMYTTMTTKIIQTSTPPNPTTPDLNSSIIFRGTQQFDGFKITTAGSSFPVTATISVYGYVI